MISRAGPLLGILATAILTTGCGSATYNKENVLVWGANGLEAPAEYTIAPKMPRTMGYPGFLEQPPQPQAANTLPPLPEHGAGNPYVGVRPLTLSANRDLLTGGAPFPFAPADPNGFVPVEQLIYGGTYPDRDEPTSYRYITGDQLRLTVHDHPEFDGVVTIAADGTVGIPSTQDRVKAEGLCPEEIARSVRNIIRPYVLGVPAVTVRTELGLGGYYTIVGGVKHPGRYPIGQHPLRLSEAVFRADSERLQANDGESAALRTAIDLSGGAREGFNDKGGEMLKHVVLITPHRAAPVYSMHDVYATLYKGRTGNDPIVKPGQIIVVPGDMQSETKGWLESRLGAGLIPGL